MGCARPAVEWTGEPLLAPFEWRNARDVLVSTDLFGDEISEEALDKTFAVMALCPRHSFRLVSSFPNRFRTYVCKITSDRDAWMNWRLEASFVLSSLGRQHEAKGHGPVWPLKNVKLADFRSEIS